MDAVGLPFPDGVLIMIGRYAEERGRRCFTYRGLRAWMYSKPEYRDVEWHTVERYIRDLVRLGYLVRKRSRKRRVRGRGRRYYIYCLSDEGERRLWEVRGW